VPPPAVEAGVEPQTARAGVTPRDNSDFQDIVKRLRANGFDPGKASLKDLRGLQRSLKAWFEANQDAFNTINRGLGLARGQYISILNSDDVYELNRCERLLSACAAQNAACVFTDVIPISDSGEVFSDPDFGWNIWHHKNRSWYFSCNDLYASFLKGNFMVTTSNLFMTAEAVRKVGILYDPDRSSDLISAFQEASAGTGIDIVPVKISSVAQLKEGLQYISKQADVLLAVPDATVYSGKTAKEVLLFSYRNSIPFIGLSSTWVEAGALYALEVNYIDIGKQCAESARQMLAGAPPAKQPKLSADKVTYTVNSKTIQQLRLNIDPELISGGLEIFE